MKLTLVLSKEKQPWVSTLAEGNGASFSICELTVQDDK